MSLGIRGLHRFLAQLHWGLSFPPELFQVWAASCSLPASPNPCPPPLSAVKAGACIPVPCPRSPLPLWDTGILVAENPSKSTRTQSLRWPLGPRAALWPCCRSHPALGTRTKVNTWSVPHPSPGLRKGTQNRNQQSWSLGTLIPAGDIHLAAGLGKPETPRSCCRGLSSLAIRALLGKARVPSLPGQGRAEGEAAMPCIGDRALWVLACPISQSLDTGFQ